MFAATAPRASRYIPVVGRAFLVEMLYGSKYSPHIGTYEMPYLYVKTLLLCATGKGLSEAQGRHVHGLVEALLPSNMSEDNLTKLELMQFVDSIPLGEPESGTEASSNEGHNEDDLHGEAADQRFSHAAHSGPDPSNSKGGTDLAAAANFISAAAFPASIARILVYDAVSACLADGVYSAQERERVALIAAQISLSSAAREEVERLAIQERVLATRKQRLLLLRPGDGVRAARKQIPGAADTPPPQQQPQQQQKQRREKEKNHYHTGEKAPVDGDRAGLSSSTSSSSLSRAFTGTNSNATDLYCDDVADARAYVRGGDLSPGDESRCPSAQQNSDGQAGEEVERRQGSEPRGRGEAVSAPAASMDSSEWERWRRAKTLLRAVRSKQRHSRTLSPPTL